MNNSFIFTGSFSISLKLFKNTSKESSPSLVKVFNIYNADESYVKKSNSIKNSVVSKIRKIISSPSNQLLANEPVSVQELHDAGDKAKKALGIEDSDLSM